MDEQSFKQAWSHIDQEADPASYVRYMDALKGPEDPANWPSLRSHLQEHSQQQVLDVGCGLGAAVRVAAKIVGSGGRSVGLDNSEAMLESARERSAGLDLPIEYYQGEAHHLPFADNTFDYCHSEGTFDVLPDPVGALDEMLRVTRPGGRLSITCSDTMLFDATDRALTRRIEDFIEDHELNGWLGRQLPGLFKERGLSEVTTTIHPMVLEDYTLVSHLWLHTYIENAQTAAVLTPEEVNRWLADLEQRAAEGRFFFVVSWFTVTGRKH